MRKQQPSGPSLTVGPTDHCKGGTIRFGNYKSGEIFIEITEDDGAAFIATVALVRRHGEHPGERGVWLKAYQDYEGLPEALARAGVLSITGRTYTAPDGEAVHAELTDLAFAHYTRAIQTIH